MVSPSDLIPLDFEVEIVNGNILFLMDTPVDVLLFHPLPQPELEMPELEECSIDDGPELVQVDEPAQVLEFEVSEKFLFSEFGEVIDASAALSDIDDKLPEDTTTDDTDVSSVYDKYDPPYTADGFHATENDWYSF